MKTRTRFCVGTVVGLMLATMTQAQTFTVLKSFSPGEATNPQAGLTLYSNVLFGTTRLGGSFGWGTVFKINTNGTGYSVLKSFTGSDGSFPQGVLTLSGSTLYGTTTTGGSGSQGVVFKVNTDGSGFMVLKNFSTSDAMNPHAGLVLSGSTLYGTTFSGGAGASGTVFKVDTNGTGFALLYNFHALSSSDGSTPEAGLILFGSTLYGTTYLGGGNGGGTVFKLNLDGTGYSVLKSFGSFVGDGKNPNARLTLSGSTLYGTTQNGGSFGSGTVFKVDTNGTAYTVLKSFTNTDGSNPRAGLTLSGTTLYGTTDTGGSSGVGVLFKVDTDGTGFASLKQFASTNGYNPRADLTMSGSTLFGTAYQGGNSGFYGTVFSMTIPSSAPIIITGQSILTGGNLRLSGSGNAEANYALERSLNLIVPTWVPQITNVSDANGVVVFTNMPNPNTNNFWRLRFVP